mgnify:CR=1 FL=1
MARTEPTYYDSRRTVADIRLGQSIRAKRMYHGWSQEELARRLEEATGQRWDQVKVSNFETSRRLLSLGQVLQVAAVFNTSLGALVNLENLADGTAPYMDSQPDMPVQGYPVERAGDL